MTPTNLKFPQSSNEVLVNGKTYKIKGNIFEFRPCIKLWIGFKRNSFKPQGQEVQGQNFKTSKTLYMPDLRNSITQVMYRNTPPIIDWEASTNRAIHLINDKYHGKFHTAIISFESRTKTKKEQILYYYEFGKLIKEKSNPFDFMHPDWIVYKQNYEQLLAKYIGNAAMIVDYQNGMEVHLRNNVSI